MAEINRLLIRDLGDGLLMRHAEPADADRLAAFNARIHGEDPYDARAVEIWTRDLLCKPHPTFQPGDFVIVEDVNRGSIVSSVNLISQTWAYEGETFGVGRPELVGTDPDYRNRGLVRAQFDVIHEWSRQRGELVQVITGIPFFYRQFGYEMGLELGGGRAGYEAQVPELEPGQEEPYRIRPAEVADVPWLEKMYRRESCRSMVHAVRDEAVWRNDLLEKSPGNVNRWVICVIETPTGQPVGYLAHPGFTWGTLQEVTRYELDEGVSYLAVTPTVLRYIWNIGKENARLRKKQLTTFSFSLGSAHPSFQAAADRLPQERKPYAFYVRVADLPAFLNRITPVLEKRLRSSVAAGHTGELKISFYRCGLRLAFQNGRVTAIEDWKPRINVDEGHAAFPNLTFLQLIFGFRTIDEISTIYVDCWADSAARVLLSALFPKKPSSVWAIS